MVEIYERILQIKREGGQAVLITVVDKEGHGPARVQTQLLFLANGEKIGTVGGGALEHAAVKAAGAVLEKQQGFLKTYLLDADDNIIADEPGERTGMLCGGKITLFFEYIGSGLPLYIFGAGHIGKALVYHLKNMGWFITLVDSRPEVLQQVSGAARSICGKYNDVLKDEPVKPGSFFVIATHSHKVDYVVLKRIYEADWQPAYIGLVASKNKRQVMEEQLKQELKRDVDLSILYCPVGLDIGGSNPDEIAISIISELQVLRYGKEGHRHMRIKN